MKAIRNIRVAFYATALLFNVALLFLNVQRLVKRAKEAHSMRNEDNGHPRHIMHPERVPEIVIDVDFDAVTPYAFGTDAPPYRWNSRYDNPQNWLILEPQMHAYRPVMAHKLHCIQIIYDATMSDNPSSLHGHVQHCLNYLRQMILCDADVTLENAEAMEINLKEPSKREMRVCRDWNAVWRESERRMAKWRAFVGSTWDLDQKPRNRT